MGIAFVNLQAQYASIKEEIDSAIQSVIDKSAFIRGEFVETFQEEFARYIGAKHCVGCANGTDAIEIVLEALGVRAGDEVLVPANTFIATSEAVTAAGATPVFVDCDPVSRNINPAGLEAKLTSKTRAIIAVHLYGLPADMDPILDFAQKNKLFVLEDSAQAHGAQYRGKRCGTLGHAATFSFYPGKNLGAYGDAGAIVTNDSDLAKRCYMISDHGRVSKYDHEFEGRNSRLDGIQAAILSVKLKYLDGWTELRRKHAEHYNRELSSLDLITPATPPGCEPVYHLYVVELKERERVRDALNKRGIGNGIHYPIVLPLLRAYASRGHTAADFPVSAALAQTILSLPMYPELKRQELDQVVQALKEVV